MAAVLRLGEADLEADIDASAHQQHLQHEVVQSPHEEDTEGSARRHFLLVCAEMLLTNI